MINYQQQLMKTIRQNILLEILLLVVLGDPNLRSSRLQIKGLVFAKSLRVTRKEQLQVQLIDVIIPVTAANTSNIISVLA